jgi:cobalt/nickel transport system permease protein
VAGSHGHPPSTGADGLYLPGRSAVHLLPAHTKVVAAVLLVCVVVATPVRAWPALLAYPLLVLGLAVAAGLPLRTVGRRMVVELPFVVFALLLPVVAAGERVDVLGVPLSVAGLVGGATLLLKATTGVLVGVLLASTTRSRDLLAGLERLRLPQPLVAISGFMLRYASVVTSDLSRMRLARAARGYGGGRLGHLRIEAAGAGTLFVRSYERGERVHRAMLARGYTGRMPSLDGGAAGVRDWALAVGVPLTAAAMAVASLAVTA